jgi:PDZ domain/Aspartyl protease
MSQGRRWAGCLGLAAAAALTPGLLRRSAGTPGIGADGAVASAEFEQTSHKPFVRVSVNGRAPAWFVLDTGANGGSVLDADLARELSLPLKDPRERRLGAGEGVTVTVARAAGVTLSLAGAALPEGEVTVFPLSHVAPYEGRAIRGLLGSDFFRRFTVRIDYARRKVTVYDPARFAYSGPGAVIPCDLAAEWCIVDATLTAGGVPIPARVIVDTGVRMGLVLNRPFAEAQVAPRVGTVVEATVGGGIGGETRGGLARLDGLALGPVALERPVVVLSRDTSGVLARDDLSGILGGPILERFTVIFDYARKRMILEPGSDAGRPMEYDMSGLFLVARPPAFDLFEVKSVLPGSPADRAGLARGDRVTRVGSKRTSELSLEELRGRLERPGERVTLTVERDGKEREVSFETRRLV